MLVFLVFAAHFVGFSVALKFIGCIMHKKQSIVSSSWINPWIVWNDLGSPLFSFGVSSLACRYIYIYTYIPWNAPRSKDAMVTTSMTWYFLDPRIPSWTFTSHWHPGRRSIPIYSSVWKDITYNLFQIAIAWVSIYSSDFRYESTLRKVMKTPIESLKKPWSFFNQPVKIG